MKIYCTPILFAFLTANVFAVEAPSIIREALANGTASGEVTSAVADNSRLKLNATGPLILEVKRLIQYEQEGCGRLQLNFRQVDALPPGAVQPSDFSWSIAMNVCADGTAPVTLKRKIR